MPSNSISGLKPHQPEIHGIALLRSALSTAALFRAVADQSPTRGRPTFSYQRSTMSLVALLESWCIDHAAELAPSLVEQLKIDNQLPDGEVLRALNQAFCLSGPELERSDGG